MSPLAPAEQNVEAHATKRNPKQLCAQHSCEIIWLIVMSKFGGVGAVPLVWLLRSQLSSTTHEAEAVPHLLARGLARPDDDHFVHLASSIIIYGDQDPGRSSKQRIHTRFS